MWWVMGLMSSTKNQLNFSKEEQQKLIQLAKVSIEFGLETGQKAKLKDLKINVDELLNSIAPCFVTLEKNDDLRGCIGSLVFDDKPLVENITKYAYLAAFDDHRFPSLTKQEWEHITVEISVLSKPELLNVNSEAELLTLLTPGQDGLILEAGSKRATFLPAVWEQLEGKKEFVTHLKRKAGIEDNSWPNNMKCSIYQAEKITE